MKKGEKVVIVGGGFAGLNFAKQMAKKDVEVILVDKQNHHQFQPLFYQVASAGLEPSSISFPFRKIFQKVSNVEFRMAEVESVVAAENKLRSSSGDISYDHLVIATGCTTNFFGNKTLEEHALPMKTTQEAIAIRNQLLLSFEKIVTASEDEKEALLNLVIVGGGPTGVELAGSFAEMRATILPKDYPKVDFSQMRIIIVEGSENTLNSMSENAKTKSEFYLKQMKVEIIKGTHVTSYDGFNVSLDNGETLKAANVIWSAGVKGNTLSGLEEATMVRNRYKTDRYNRIQGFENIYAIGDISYMETPFYPLGHPQLANVAINQGKNLAKNLLGSCENKMWKEYEYNDLGSMATIGKHKAVVDLPQYKFSGYFAWLIWMFLHLMLILSTRNKLIIFFNWAWSYITNDSSLRLILDNNDKKSTDEK
jgi:NADH dehydrogenase